MFSPKFLFLSGMALSSLLVLVEMSISSPRAQPMPSVLEQTRGLPIRGNAPITNTFTGIASVDATVVFTTTGSMTAGRYAHTATLLNNGLVIVVGGRDFGTGTIHASAELYDPATGTFTVTGNLVHPRYSHRATLLPNGNVLITGGSGPYGGSSDYPLFYSEVYDPTTRTFTDTGSMKTARVLHSATLLQDGRVLVAGGYISGGYASSAEIYDSNTGTFSDTGSLAVYRAEHTATRLQDGRVLVTGGCCDPDTGSGRATVEIYAPNAGNFTSAGDMTEGRYMHTATLLPNAQVLVAGGCCQSGTTFIGTAELYNPATNSFTKTGNLNVPRYGHLATLMPSGEVLVTGGASNKDASAEIYHPSSKIFSTSGDLVMGRYLHTSTLLPNGKVLVTGGIDASDSLFFSRTWNVHLA